MRSFKEFLDEDICVSFTCNEELDAFLNLCDMYNLHWSGGQNALEWKPKLDDCTVANYDNYIVANYNAAKGTICLYVTFNSSNKYKIIPVNEFLSYTNVSIFTNGNTTICLRKDYTGKVVARGIAKCDPSDCFDSQFGSDLAYLRMKKNCESNKNKKAEIDKQIDKLLHPMPKLAKTKNIKKQDSYNVGDKVKIKKKIAMSCFTNEMEKYLGKTMTVRFIDTHNDLDRYSYYMEEDIYEYSGNSHNGWVWDISQIKGKVTE